MITNTFDKLATITLPSATSSITFGSLPTNYKDLVIMGQFDLTNSLEAFRIYFNNDINNSSYNVALMGGNGQQASGGASNGSMIYYEGSSTGSMSIKMDILDYTSSNKHAVSLHTISNPDSWVGQYVNRWLASTNPVTSVTLKCDLSTIAAGSVFSLYGVAG